MASRLNHASYGRKIKVNAACANCCVVDRSKPDRYWRNKASSGLHVRFQMNGKMVGISRIPSAAEVQNQAGELRDSIVQPISNKAVSASGTRLRRRLSN